MANTLTSRDPIDHFIYTYGDLIFDLCESVLRNSTVTQIAFRAIARKVKSEQRKEDYQRYERSWVLRVAVSKLLDYCHEGGRNPSPQEQIILDSTSGELDRIEHFHSYFYRLLPEDQILLLLKDKYKIPYSEISIAMAIPVGSLKVRRLQVLRILEDWLWNSQ